MRLISSGALSVLLFCALRIPVITAQSTPLTPGRDPTTRQALDFQRIVQILGAIVEAIQNAVDDPTKPSAVNLNLDDLILEPFPTDEALITDITDEALPSPESLNQPPSIEIPYKLHFIEPLSGQADAAVILLHGLGQQVETLLPIANALRLVTPPNIRFIVPQASAQYVTILDTNAPSWFDITSTDPSKPEKTREILMAATNIAAIRDQQHLLHGIPASRVALLGLSQGGAVALTAYMRYQWAGVMTISTWLPLRDTYPEQMSNDSALAKLVMLHGAEDRVIQKEWARLSANLIKKWGRNVSYVELEGEGHELSGAMDIVINTALTTLNEALV